jgi:hypothetical protein
MMDSDDTADRLGSLRTHAESRNGISSTQGARSGNTCQVFVDRWGVCEDVDGVRVG